MTRGELPSPDDDLAAFRRAADQAGFRRRLEPRDHGVELEGAEAFVVRMRETERKWQPSPFAAAGRASGKPRIWRDVISFLTRRRS